MDKVDPISYFRDLEQVADFGGEAFGRLNEYWVAETKHVEIMRSKHAGSIYVFRAYQCMFLESVELINTLHQGFVPAPKLPFYTRFIPRMVHVFQQLSASELAATHGYPLPAYTLLRNSCDTLILISAAMQNLTDLFNVDGYDPSKEYDPKQAKRLRLRAEREIREKLLGKNSGLSEDIIKDLKLWDDMFDLEVHGGKISLASATDWINGGSPRLYVYPEYNDFAAALFSNRLPEVAWMSLRLMPLLQHTTVQFSEVWRERWSILDRKFYETVKHFASQQKVKVGDALIKFVQEKFPFSATSLYPLEGSEWHAKSVDSV